MIHDITPPDAPLFTNGAALPPPPGASSSVAAPEQVALPGTKRIQILGPFNSGSSFAEHLFRTNNLDLTELDFQQTLFKHYPPALVARLIDLLGLRCDDVLFVAPVRHPGVWVDAMERNRYELVYDDFDAPCHLDAAVARNFHKSYKEHLLDLGLSAAEVDGYFSFKSIFDVWERSYRGYLELSTRAPVSIVRYEDMLADTPRTILGLRERMGLPPPETIIIPLRPSKDHGDALSFVHARRKLIRQRTEPDTLPHAALVRDRISHDLLDSLCYL